MARKRPGNLVGARALAVDRVGSRRALLAADHRGRVWGPFEGPHYNIGSRRALLAADHRGRVWGPFEGPHYNIGSRRALLAADHRGRVWGPFEGPHYDANYETGLSLAGGANGELAPATARASYSFQRAWASRWPCAIRARARSGMTWASERKRVSVMAHCS